MLEINNEFWIVRTSINCYFNLFINHFNKLLLSQKIMIIDEKTLLIINDLNNSKNEKYEFSSKSKLNQSLVFFKQINNSKTYIKIIEPIYDDEYLFDYTKTKILETTNNKIIKKYRNSIILKYIYLLNKDCVKKMNIYSMKTKIILITKK